MMVIRKSIEIHKQPIKPILDTNFKDFFKHLFYKLTWIR